MKRIWMVASVVFITLMGCTSAGTPGAASTSSPPALSADNSQPPAAPTSLPADTVPPTPGPTAVAVASSPTTLPTTAATGPASPTTPAAASTKVVPPAGQINLPAGFGISVFASGLDTPRNVVVGPDKQLYVAERGAGRILRLPDRNQAGVATGVDVIASGFDRPGSLAFYKDGSLYVSTPTQVFRLSQPDANGVFQKREVVIDGLPGPQGHFTRTLAFSPDWASLFIQVGSSCNACVESDSRRATIMRFNSNGSGGEIYARGLRNAVGIIFRPGTSELWATNNGSDALGDNTPPDTILIVHQNDNYGWPRCEVGVLNPQFGGSSACNGISPHLVDIQAHSAALGLTFYTGDRFPADYRGDLFVALHGSIYRSVPTGYKVVRIHLTNGQPGPVQDFATGWLPQSGRAWGRPVDLVTAPDGSLMLSDDSGGNIYRIFYAGG